MPSSFQRFIIWTGAFLPFYIRHILYLLPLWKLKSLLFFFGVSAWARNSVYFKEEVFGLSDLDLTLYAKKKISPWKKKLILLYLKLLRFFFPFVGEVVVYEKDSIKKMIGLASQIELKRDPLLLREVGETDGQELRRAFILNWVFNDYHRMDAGMLKRKNKIDRFRKLLNLPAKSYFSAEDLLMDLLKEFINDEQKRGEWFAVLQRFLRAYRIEQQPINEWLEKHRDQQQIIALCYPQVWMGAAIHSETFHDTLYQLKNYSDEDKKVFKEQISWELWGLYSNMFFTSMNAELILHLDHLKECVREVLDDAQLTEGIENLRRLYESV